MSNLTIITNNVPRDVVEAHELSEAERTEFDYIDWPAIKNGEASASFVRYMGETYDLGEFLVCNGPLSHTPWQGVMSDSFFSGILVRYCDDYERVVVGRYYS